MMAQLKEKLFELLMANEGRWIRHDTLGKAVKDPTNHFLRSKRALKALRKDIHSNDLGTLEENTVGGRFWKFARNPRLGRRVRAIDFD